MNLRSVAFAGVAAVLLAGFAWVMYPISIPSEAYEVTGLESDEIDLLKEALWKADVSRNSSTLGRRSQGELFILDCGDLLVASVWDFDDSAQIIIAFGAESRFPGARPAISALRKSVELHAGKLIHGADADFSALDKFMLKYREGVDPDVRC